MKPTQKEIADFIEEAKLVADNPFIRPGISAEEATQVRRIARITVVLDARVAELEALLGAAKLLVELRTARIAELERERAEMLGLLGECAEALAQADETCRSALEELGDFDEDQEGFLPLAERVRALGDRLTASAGKEPT